MPFQKGQIAWNKGIPCTEETKLKISLANMGKKGWNKGIPLSEEQKQNLRKFHLGKKLSSEHKRKLSESNKGKMMGEKNPNWNGGCRRYYQNVAFRVWEEYWNQEIPKGYCLHHIDEDYKNNDISNLPMITPSLHEKIHLKNTNRDLNTGRFI